MPSRKNPPHPLTSSAVAAAIYLMEVVIVRRLAILLSCLAISPALILAQQSNPHFILAQQSDPHFQTQQLALTVQRSAFMHGYLHGYEEGFHEADFDLHMGRLGRGEPSHEHVRTGYKKQFGSKHMFEAGFRQGLRVGYADGASERSFRAFNTVVAAATMTEGSTPQPPTAAFDEGIHAGYVAGQHQGLDDARHQRGSKPAPACPVNSGPTQQEFCTAYSSGYGMGYSDGFVNQSKVVVAEAK